MYEFLNNYWVGLLLLGPLAGVFWAYFFGGSASERRPELQISGNTGQVVVGNNSGNRVSNSYNRNVVNNYHGSQRKNDDDAMGWVIMVAMIGLFICAALAWGMAKYGNIIVEVEFVLAGVVGAGLLFKVTVAALNEELFYDEAVAALCLFSIVLLSFVSLTMVEANLRADVVDLVNSHTNVIKFFFDLSAYGKTLLITQALSVILVFFAVFYVLLRYLDAFHHQVPWHVDLVLLLTIFGAGLVWLSNPEWSVEFVLARLS